MGARRDSSRVAETFMWDSRSETLLKSDTRRGAHTLVDLLALVDLGDLLLHQLVTLLADLHDLLTLETPS